MKRIVATLLLLTFPAQSFATVAVGGSTATPAVDSAVVHKAQTETITGTKTFTQTIQGSVSGNAGTATNATNLNGNPASYYQPAGTAITSGNIGAQSVNHAASADSAGTASNLSGTVTETQVVGLVTDLTGRAGISTPNTFAAFQNLSGGMKTSDIIAKRPSVDVRAYMDGQSGRPTLAYWQANPTSDATAAVQAAANEAAALHRILDLSGMTAYVSGIVISSDLTVRGGNLIAAGATDRGFIIQSGARLTLRGVTISGARPTVDSNTTNHGAVVDSGTVDMDETSTIKDFAGVGIYFVAGGAYDAVSSIRGVVQNCGTGIYTNQYEYVDINGARIIDNGLNAAKTDWSGIWGPGTGYGIYGSIANTQIVDCTINGNAVGVFLDGVGGSNPDHNKILGCTINHNYAAGLILKGNQSYETVIGNTMLSNVTIGSAPGVVYAPRSSSVDMALEDVIGAQFIGNDIGPGSDIIGPAIFGYARTRWIGNNFIYYPPTELRHPQTGTAVYDYYGYLKNGDNYFDGNMYRNESIAGQHAVFLADSVRTVETHAIMSAGAGSGSGGGTMEDDVVNKVGYTNSWASVGASIESWYMKHGKKVDIYIYATAPAATTSSITTLPADYRPVGAVQMMAEVGASLSSSYATFYTDGTVTVVGATQAQPVLIHGSFVTAY